MDPQVKLHYHNQWLSLTDNCVTIRIEISNNVINKRLKLNNNAVYSCNIEDLI